MNRRLPTILSVLLLALLAVLALFLILRDREPTDAPPEPTPPPAASTPSPTPPPSPATDDREGLVGPAGIAGALPDMQRCYAEHGAAEELEPGLTIVFTVAVDPDAPRRLARAMRARVKPEDEVLGEQATTFEACVERAVRGIELVAPGGRDSLDIPMAFQLGV